MKNEADFIKRLTSPRYRDKAFAELLDQYQQRLYWHIRKLVLTHENADDVLQNTFLRIYKSLPNFKQQSSLGTWMYRIAHNESLRFLENEKKKKHASLDDEANNYLNILTEDVYFEGKEVQLKLQRVLSELPEKQRKIFQMKYYDDLKFREMANILGAKEGTLKSSYYNAVKHIEDKMLDVELLTKTKV
ncbi:MAG: RNA polymerase sigma factor [Maribacter sp.]